MQDKLIVDLDNTITIDSSSLDYATKKLNAEVALAIKNASKLEIETTIFSSRNMKTFNGDLEKIESVTRPIAENWLQEKQIKYSELILGKPWCGKEGWYVDDKNLSIEEFVFKYTGPFWTKKVDLIIPLLNEGENIKNLHIQNKKIERLLNINNYIYVDNGSKDNTRERLNVLAEKDTKIKLVLLDNNLGYGGGIKAGLKSSSAEIISLNHADLQFDLYNFIYLNMEKIKDRHCLNILPQRFNRRLFERINSFLLRTILSAISRKQILDFNGQPKIFEKSLVGSLDELPDNFCLDLALYLKINKNFINMPVIQNERNAGESTWSGSMYKRVLIFCQYILWALKNK